MKDKRKRLVAYGVDIGRRHVRGVDTVFFKGQTLVVGKWNRIVGAAGRSPVRSIGFSAGEGCVKTK